MYPELVIQMYLINTAIGVCPSNLKILVTAIFFKFKWSKELLMAESYYHRCSCYLISLGICWSASGNISPSWNWHTVMRRNGNPGWDDLWDPQKMWRGQGEACSWRSVTVLGGARGIGSGVAESGGDLQAVYLVSEESFYSHLKKKNRLSLFYIPFQYFSDSSHTFFI